MVSRMPSDETRSLARVLLETLDPAVLANNFFEYLLESCELKAVSLLEWQRPSEDLSAEPGHPIVVAEKSQEPGVSLIHSYDCQSLYSQLAQSAGRMIHVQQAGGGPGNTRELAALMIEDTPSSGRSLALLVASRPDHPLTPNRISGIKEAASLFALALQNCELYESTRSCLENIAGEAADRGTELEQQRALMENVIDSLPVGLYVIDRQYRIVAWNRNRELGTFGIKRSDALGKSLFDVLRRYPRGRVQAEMEQVFQSSAIDRREASTELDGETRNFQVTKIPMRLGGEGVTHVITLSEDITDRKRMLERASNSEKLAAVGQLAAGVVHEINNPLATIAICAESLSLRVDQSPELLGDDAPEFAEYLKLIESESYRCKGITNSLLDFSRAQVAAKEPLDMNRVVEQTLFLMKHHSRFKSIDLRVELESDLPPVLANDGQIKQAIMAMLINAVDAMEDGGQLTVRSNIVRGQNPFAAVEIIDNGCGIPQSSLSKIFDPFFTTKPRGTGTGLGLSVSYGIVTEHGGRILVGSKEGEGTHFKILLPILNQTVSEACLQ